MKLLRIAAIMLVYLSALEVLPAQIVVVGALSQIRDAEPGGTYTGTVTVRNDGTATEEAKVYPRDYLFYADGRTLYAEPSTTSRSNVAWMTYSPTRISIGPGQSQDVRYTVRIPDVPGLAGTYWSILMVEGIPPDSPESAGSDSDEPKIGVRQVMRYGVQLVTTVGADALAMLQIVDADLAQEDEGRALRVDVENSGERWLRIQPWTELYDAGGKKYGPIEALARRTYPGTSVRFTFDLSGLPTGQYTALVVFDGGGSDVFGSQYSLTLR